MTVYHYGSYEASWLRRFKTRLSCDYANQIDKLLDRAVNVLTVFSSSVYLVLLSVQQTCKYRGVNFLDFLRSRASTIQEYCGE